MAPVLEGVIRRRRLVNFRADHAAVRSLVPAPLEVVQHRGAAIISSCLIGRERLRPKGLPQFAGPRSENMTHRVAVRHKGRDGGFIRPRDTDQCRAAVLGGQVFPGVHHWASFDVEEHTQGVRLQAATRGREADVTFAGEFGPFAPSPAFPTLAEASNFFAQGDCGFSCAHSGERWEGMRLKILRWALEPVRVVHAESAFFTRRLPIGTVQFDYALILRGVPHQWHELAKVLELRGAFATATEA